jgi:hypothetical protein
MILSSRFWPLPLAHLSVFSNPLVLEPLGLGDVEQLRGWNFKPELDLISKVNITEH